jgi:hypothetical protein
MAAAPATAAAALVILNNATGKIVAVGAFDLGQVVGATNDASCLIFSRDHNNGANLYAMFVSAATSVASAGVLAVARSMRGVGINVIRYVISTTDLQTMTGPDATATFVSAALAPTDVEWIDTVNRITENYTTN